MLVLEMNRIKLLCSELNASRRAVERWPIREKPRYWRPITNTESVRPWQTGETSKTVYVFEDRKE
jgi:hypothetical protein